MRLTDLFDRLSGQRISSDITIVLALAAASACVQPGARLAAPVFTPTMGLPAFIVECRNTTDRPISPVNPIGALRLDGATIKSRGSIGSLLGGYPPDVAPGKTWNYMIVLHPGTVTRTSNVGLQPGMFKTDWGVPMEKRPHTVAFQCAGEWTAEVSFDF